MKKLYICYVIFFIVLDLRLTKVGVQRYSFFLLYTFLFLLHILGQRNNLRDFIFKHII